jgi:hypothetical protein
VSRLFAAMAIGGALLCAYLGLRQSTSMALREPPPAYEWSRGGYHVGGWEPGRGHVVYTGRSEWFGFRGGGPGHGK